MRLLEDETAMSRGNVISLFPIQQKFKLQMLRLSL